MKKEIIKALASTLKQNGFKRKGQTWFKDYGELVYSINLQKSDFGAHFYINVGYIIKELLLENFEYFDYSMNHIIIRSERLLDSMREDVLNSFDLEIPMDDEIRLNNIKNLILPELINLGESHSSVVALADAMKTRWLNKGFVRKEVKELLEN